jgi:hypothetical protein
MDIAGRRRMLPIAIFTTCFLISISILYFSVSSSFTDSTERTLRRSTESSHGDMVLFASNALQAELEELTTLYNFSKSNIDWEAFSTNDMSEGFRRKVEMLFKRSDVVKLKVYASDGMTIFSTDSKQIGEEKSEVEAVTHALRGRSSSQFSVRENFMTISGNRSNIEVVSSYHPLQSRAGTIIGVVEIYSDRSSDFEAAATLVKTKLSSIIIIIAITVSIWLINIVYFSLKKRSGDV